MEVCCEYTDDKIMWVSADQQKVINRIRKLKEQYPDDVTIEIEPQDNDGCIYARMPADWLKISPPLTRTMTDEQRQAASERMKRMNAMQKEGAVDVDTD